MLCHLRGKGWHCQSLEDSWRIPACILWAPVSMRVVSVQELLQTDYNRMGREILSFQHNKQWLKSLYHAFYCSPAIFCNDIHLLLPFGGSVLFLSRKRHLLVVKFHRNSALNLHPLLILPCGSKPLWAWMVGVVVISIHSLVIGLSNWSSDAKFQINASSDISDIQDFAAFRGRGREWMRMGTY